MEKPFTDRKDGGKRLAEKLSQYQNDPDTIVIGLPRGGVITAKEVADALQLPLDIVVPRKIGAPFNEELAVGAITQDGDVIWNEDVMRAHRLEPEDLIPTIEKERAEAQRRLAHYQRGKDQLSLRGKTVLLVDDGIATGATMMAAIAYAKKLGAGKIVVATPVATVDTMEKMAREANEIVSVLLPKIFLGISAFYEDFPQTSDDEVIAILNSVRPEPVEG